MPRRVATHDPDEDGYLPSWSFFGWHGIPDSLSYIAGKDYTASMHRSTLMLKSLVKWFQMGPTVEDAESGQVQQGEAVRRPQRRIESEFRGSG
ncbi:hypothetical protein SLS58_002852 [Diplodia intermedia]|uniref:Uncharacterized protein n=1 Tax=Diplodia intermedia TaxID=856260 RepID=A0ABR3TXT7_9PEZI